MAEEEDNKMAERWQKDADGILIFVSSELTFYLISHIKSTNLDRFVLCCRCSIGVRSARVLPCAPPPFGITCTPPLTRLMCLTCLACLASLLALLALTPWSDPHNTLRPCSRANATSCLAYLFVSFEDLPRSLLR